MSKVTKKHFKNLYKCLKHLSVLVGYECTLSVLPTRYIILGNAGHANCIGKSDVISLIPELKCTYQIFFPPQKQFSVLITESVCDNLVAQLNLRKIRNTVIYCSFVAEQLSFETLQETSIPPGLKILEEIVDHTVEQNLIDYFLEKASECPHDDLKNRVTIHFGYKFDYKTNSVDLSSPLDVKIPHCVAQIISLISPQISIKPNQLTVNIYQPGQGIPKHVDTHSIFTSEILSLSLGSDTVMEFKNPSTGTLLPVIIPARSLTVMSGESRYLWHHGITPRKHDNVENVKKRGMRISLTLRECTSEPCTCDYPTQCDSQNYGKPHFSVSSEQDATRLEQQFVSEVYDEIADHFSDTRHTMWPGVVRFIESLEPHSLVVDVGCGNGKYLGCRSDVFAIGSDNSSNLCMICRDRNHEVFCCNALNIPLRSNSCDSVICIAMLHHITTHERRVKVLQNLANLMRPGGLGLVTVWAQEQHLDIEVVDTVRPCPTNMTEENVGRRHFEDQDVFVDWRLKTPGASNTEFKLYYRYYHVFQKGELEKLFSDVSSVEVVSCQYEKANWCAVFRKL